MINLIFMTISGRLTINSIVAGGVGYLATRAVTSLNPQIGLAFGALYGVSRIIVSTNLPNILTDSRKSYKIFNNLVQTSLNIAVRTALVAVVLKQGFNISLNNKSIMTLGAIALLTPIAYYDNSATFKLRFVNFLAPLFNLIFGK